MSVRLSLFLSLSLSLSPPPTPIPSLSPSDMAGLPPSSIGQSPRNVTMMAYIMVNMGEVASIMIHHAAQIGTATALAPDIETERQG